ncbi:MAG: response regulator transcription factor [Pseudomonadota bacterium]
MDKATIFSKTAKGMTEFKNGGKSLAREHARVLGLINGKSSIAALIEQGALPGKYTAALEALLEHGLIRVFDAGIKHLPEMDWTASAIDIGDDLGTALPTLEVQELSPQESVEIWAQARRGATELKSTGFYSYGKTAGAPMTLSLESEPVGMTALVVEDDEDLGELLTVLLAEKGITVTLAADLKQALQAVQANTPPTLVLLDVVLPGMPGKDGFDVLSFIRRKPEWAKVPVVMVTSEVSDDQVMKGLKAGADGYIFKPFKWETLYACIQKVIGI